MKDIVNRPPTEIGLPEDFASQIAAGIAESRATTVLGGGGKPFLRLLKSGNWVFGQENEEVQPGSRWIINSLTLAHGFCCWVDTGDKNTLKGDVMVPMTRPKPACPPPIDGTPFVEQRAFELKCLDGADAGIEVLYKTNSDGGMKAADAVMVAVQQQALIKGNVHLFPIVTMEQTSYKHAKYGEIFKPIFTIHGWADIHATQAEQPSVEPAEPAKPAAPAKPPKPPLQAPQTPVEPVSTTQAHVGQRRRPATR
jgi:hypothetical protein